MTKNQTISNDKNSPLSKSIIANFFITNCTYIDSLKFFLSFFTYLPTPSGKDCVGVSLPPLINAMGFTLHNLNKGSK